MAIAWKLKGRQTAFENCDLKSIVTIESEEWRQHSSLIFLIILFTKPNIEFRGWLYQTKTQFTHIVYQPFSRVLPPSFTLYGYWLKILYCMMIQN